MPATAKSCIKLKNNLKGTLNSSDIKTIKENCILGWYDFTIPYSFCSIPWVDNQTDGLFFSRCIEDHLIYSRRQWGTKSPIYTTKITICFFRIRPRLPPTLQYITRMIIYNLISR